MTIYEALKDDQGQVILPDSKDLVLKEDEKWVPGAFEGIILRNGYGIKQHLVVNFYISRVVRRFVLHPTPENYNKMEKVLSKYSAISIVDPLISLLTSASVPAKALADAAKEILYKTGKREIFKIAIALLGQWGDKADGELIYNVGLFEEFTFYSVNALSVMFKDEPDVKNEYLIKLGNNTSGWGKISVLYELDYESEIARDWVLRKGCSNSIGLSYTANVCAIKGKMLSLLQDSDKIDREMYLGICDIFTGLLECDRENDTITEYPDAFEAAVLFYRISENEELSRDTNTEYIISKLKEFKYV